MGKKQAVEEKPGCTVTCVGAVRPDVIFTDKNGRRWNAYLNGTNLHGEDSRGYCGVPMPACSSEEAFRKFAAEKGFTIVEMNCDQSRLRVG